MSKPAGLAQENGFGSLVKGPSTLFTCKKKECNKYDLTAARCF
jgi:hypothetical protein